MKVQKTGAVVEVDIHGLRAEDAEYRLRHLIDNAGSDVTEIVVIHGYNRGQTLRDMVWNTLSHPRIQTRLKSLNEGKSRILLKKPPRKR